MRVYNVTQGEITYRGKKIPPNGGSVEFQDITFIPNRDLALQDAKMLAFGSLPKWWKVEQALKTKAPVAAQVVAAVVAQPGVPNANGDIFPEKKIVITTSEVGVSDKLSMSMSSDRKKK